MAATGSILQNPIVRAYGIPVLLILAALGIAGFLSLPAWGEIQDLGDQITEEQERIGVLKNKIEVLLDFADQQNALDEKFALFEQAVAQESKVPELLTKIQQLSDSCGLDVRTLQFGGEGTDGPAGKVREVRVRYASQGSFSQLVCVVNALETSSRIIDAESINYRSSRTDSGSLILSPDMVLIAYYTPEPVLVPANPINFSLSSPALLETEELLQSLK